VIVATPAALGVKVTEHVPAADRVHVGAEKVPAAPVEVKDTVPAGVLPPAPPMSTTVAVHVESWLIGIEAGAQDTVVEVGRPPVLTVPLPAPLLVDVA
jgi:hypothetical protein